MAQICHPERSAVEGPAVSLNRLPVHRCGYVYELRLTPLEIRSFMPRPLARLALPLLLSLCFTLKAQETPFTRQPDGITIHVTGQTVRVQVITDSILHITATPTGATLRPSIAVIAQPSTSTPWQASSSASEAILTTARIKATVNLATGAISFADAHTGAPILAEAARTLTPAEVQGEKTWHIEQQWLPNSDESLFGLGQQQLGIVDLKGYDLDLWQHNTNVVVPYLVSSRGYGIFWDNTSFTRFGDLRPFEPIQAYQLFDTRGVSGGLTVTYPGTSIPPASSSALSVDFVSHPGASAAPTTEWNGSVLAPVTGDYQLRAYHNGGLKVWIDGKLVMDHWLQAWLTTDQQVKLPLAAGKYYKIRILTDGEQQTRMRLWWKTPGDPHTSLWSEVGDGVQYDFVYGPKLDDVVAGYRTLTGKAVMMPSWIFGLWQSRQRYETAQQSLDVVKQFRARRIPFDNIVQDWQYWHPDSWGSHEFDPARFPDPRAWIADIHKLHANLMISVWGKFNPNTENARQMQARGFLYQPDLDEHMKDWIGFPYTFYDAFNADARKLFWQQIDAGLFSKGIDAWWMDASEPDLLPGEPPSTPQDQQNHMPITALGSGARMLNGWALENAKSIYEGQRGSSPNQRVFTLTRSGYAGQQRFAAATWSGDVTSTWTAFARQITAGLGMSLAGVPYWTTDTAGYTMQTRFMAHGEGTAPNPADEDEFRELNARWFQFSTFTPLLRVHGEVRPREMWLLGKDASGGTDTPVYNAELKYDRIRYRLFPYIYSLAGAVTQHDATILRPLVMDFPADTRARTLTDEFLFGPSLLVAPVVHYKQRSREVYLPGATPWYNLWTGRLVASPTIEADAPYDDTPVFVRAGSILPLGPDIQYIGERPEDPITLHLYTGADGTFTLYEDQGRTFDYERGAFTEIPIAWSESTHTLTLGRRSGSFPEMLRRRVFQIVVTSPATPAAFSLTAKPIRTVAYEGSPVAVKLP
jgi:alpha-D-xyloside xylohydrolase